MNRGMSLRAAICMVFMSLSLCSLPGHAAAADTGGGIGTSGDGISTTTAGRSFSQMATAEEKQKHAANKVAQLLKLLSSLGSDPATLYRPTYTGSSIGVNFTVPGTDMSGFTFYTRPDATREVWHVALSYSANSLNKPSPLTAAYSDLAKILGAPSHEALTLIVSEDVGTVAVRDLPPAVQNALNSFGTSITLHKGVNFFTRVKMPNTPAFKTLASAILMGGEIDVNGTVGIAGSVGYDMLGTVLAGSQSPPNTAELQKEDAQKRAAKLPPVSLTVMLPGIIPAPFNTMDAADAKRSFYMSVDRTGFSIAYDKANGQVSLYSNQDVTLWVNNRELKTTRTVSFAKDTSPGSSKYVLSATGEVVTNIPLFQDVSLKKISLSGSTNVDIVKSTWEPGVVDKEATRNAGITLGGHRGTAKEEAAPKDATAAPAGSNNQKTSDLSVALGVTVNVNGVGDLGGALGLTTETDPSRRVRVKEVFMQFNGDPATNGLNLGMIPALRNIPAVRDLSIRGLGIGIVPATQSRATDFYLYSDLEWVRAGVRGQIALSSSGRDVTLISRVSDFDLPKVIKAIDPKADLAQLQRDLAFKMPSVVMVASTAAPGKTDNNLTVAELPSMIRPMFNDIVTDINKRILIPANGFALMGSVDFSRDQNMRNAMGALGVQASGNLILIGSIGTAAGATQVGLYANLPTFTFPQQNPQMSRVLSVPQAGGNLFVRADTKGSLSIGVGTDLRLSVPAVAGTERENSGVDLTAEIYANVTATGMGIRVAGYTKSPWERPLGFDGITLNNAAILIGADSEGAVELGMGTSLTFDLSGPNNQKVKLASLEPKNKKDLRSNLHELEKQLNNKGGAQKVDVSAAFVVNVILSGGVPVPKKLGLLYNSSIVSIPTTLDIFDLILRDLVTGPAYDEILRTTKEPGLSVLKDIRRGFEGGNWIPPSQKVAKAFPVPLDAIYLENVELFFATPGAVLPGFPGLDGNVGLKIKGDLWVTDLKTRKKAFVGKAAIDLTLNGLDFGAIGKEIEKSYNQIASVTIDALVAESNCPAGALYDTGTASCWSCPTGYERTWSPVFNDDGCKQVRLHVSKATELGTANQPWSCPVGSFYDPRNQGECWSCPSGYLRSEQEVTDANKACFRIDLSKIANYARAQKYGKAYGLLGTDCPGGQFWHMGDGNCYSCPSGTVRHVTDVNSTQACIGIGNQQVMAYAAAKLLKPGRPAGSFLDLGLGKFYSCPKGYDRTVFAVTANNACERLEVNFAVGKSEPRGQFRNMSTDKCFGAVNKKLAHGTKVVVQPCLDQDSRFQSWFLDSLKRLRPIQQLEITQGALCLDVEGGKGVNGANIRIANCVGTAEHYAQQWVVSADGQVRSKLDGTLCLGYSGNNIVLQTCVDTTPDKLTQSWKFGPSLVKPVAAPGTTVGPVLVKLKSNPDLCIESVTAAGMKACTGQTPQVWYLDSKGSIRNANGSQCLDATAGSRSRDGVATVNAACNDKAESQRWMQNPASQFVNGLGRCLGTTSNGTLETRACLPVNADMQAWTYVTTPNSAPDMATAERNLEAQRQAWFREYGHIRPGAFRVASSINETLCLAAATTPMAKGMGIMLDNCANTTSTLQFNLSPDGKNLELGNGLCLDVSGGSKNDGAKLQAWECNISPAQNFEYQLATSAVTMPQLGGKCADAAGGNLVKGTIIQSWTCNKSNAQKWKVK